MTVNTVIVPQPTTSRRRFNLKKTNWDGFSTEFDAAIEEVNPIPENYGRFIELLRVVSYIPQEYVDQTAYLVSRRSPKDSMQATLLATVHWRLEQSWSTQWKNRWGINRMRSSRRTIGLTTVARHGRLSGSYPTTQPLQTPPCLVNANQVAHQLLVNGRGTMPTKPKRPVLTTVEGIPGLVSTFSKEEYRKGIAALKYNKAAGIDAQIRIRHKLLLFIWWTKRQSDH